MDYIIVNNTKHEKYLKFLEKLDVDIVNLVKEGKYELSFQEVWADNKKYVVPSLRKIGFFERLKKKLFKK